MKFSSVRLNQLEQAMKREKITSCLVYQRNGIALEYFKNKKNANKLFQVHSVTKSVLSIALGIAMEEGVVGGTQTPISRYLPEVESAKEQVTIGHLLTMTPGFHWPEWEAWGGRPFPMISSTDWVKFVLERKMDLQPGHKMIYNSGASHVLSAILQSVTGQKTSAYAEEKLFAPLGIQEYRWYEDSKRISIGGFGLCLRTEDMLKLGLLMMKNGVWDGKPIVSGSWVDRSTAAYYHTYDKWGSYGYHWWVLADEMRRPYDPKIFFAMGYGGQYIIVCPELQIVVVFTSELCRDTTRPLQLFKAHLLDSMLEAAGTYRGPLYRYS
ncbi:serine hydrolase domain-containing protein [Paenibacillus sp. y28]|uniref:serine hydrolase domain-containing protein n=1 Tax=Paenibacillus sp. y28 TaxID=3129110 RepID=UPI003018D6D9